jgi:hypothetical protein
MNGQRSLDKGSYKSFTKDIGYMWIFAFLGEDLLVSHISGRTFGAQVKLCG